MHEPRAIANAIEAAGRRGRKGALATVIAVTGSAYRHPGAKMFIDEHGTTVGTISGGCLESDVAEVAKQVMETNRPLRKRYVMDEELVWGLGLGCPGTVEIYVEPLFPNGHLEMGLANWVKAVQTSAAGVLCTLFDPDTADYALPPARLYVGENGFAAGEPGDAEWQKEARKWAEQALRLPHPISQMHSINGSGRELFFDVYMPPPEVMIFGAGHDAIPLAANCRSLGFAVTMVDPRPAYNNEERFPGARHLLLDPGHEGVKLEIGSRTYAVIMNHHLERDKAALRHALLSQAAYVGMLGPRKRQERIMQAMFAEGVSFTEEQLSRLHNPVGLDLGAETPEEIAVSIAAEIIAVRKGHDGSFLREKQQIHGRIHAFS